MFSTPGTKQRSFMNPEEETMNRKGIKIFEPTKAITTETEKIKEQMGVIIIPMKEETLPMDKDKSLEKEGEDILTILKMQAVLLRKARN